LTCMSRVNSMRKLRGERHIDYEDIANTSFLKMMDQAGLRRELRKPDI
jgi:hypothetical protein